MGSKKSPVLLAKPGLLTNILYHANITHSTDGGFGNKLSYGIFANKELDMTFGTTMVQIQMTPASEARKEFEMVSCQRGTAAYAQVSCLENLPVYGIDITIDPLKGSSVFAVEQGRTQKVRLSSHLTYPLRVPIRWDRTTRDLIPFTRDRKTHRDNVNLILMLPDGEFVNVELALATRWGNFFMTAQRVYQGQLVRTRVGGKLTTTTIPTASIHAYPGCTFEGIWSTVADACIANAKEMHASEQRSRMMRYHAEWAPPELTQPVKEGWAAGITTYFDMLSGTGNILGVDGVNYFAHFKNIFNDNGVRDAFPVLTPMAVVQFQPDKTSKGDRPAVARVMPVKPIPIEEPAHTK